MPKYPLLCLLFLVYPVKNTYSGESSGPELFFSLSRAVDYRAAAPVDARSVDIPAEGGQAGTAADLLRDIPGLNVRRLNGSAGAATLSMRGFQAKQTAVLLDDVRLPADITGTVDLSLLPAAGLGRIEILPGAVSSVYGANAEGGVVQLFTRKLSPGAKLASAEASYGSYGTQDCALKAGAATKKAEAFFSGSSYSTAGFQRNAAAARDSATWRASLDLGAAGKISMTSLYSRLKTGLPSGTPAAISSWNGSAERAANSLTDSQTSRRGFAGVSWSGGGRDLSFRADASAAENRIEALQYGSLTTAAVRDRNAGVRLTFGGVSVLGAEATASTLDSAAYGGHTVNSYGVFTQAALKPAEKLEVTPGLRLDRSGVYPGRLSPRVSAVYMPGQAWKLSASAGMGFQAPTFADLYNPWAPAPAGLKPETSLNYQGGASYGAPSGWYIAGGFYYSVIRDRIALDPLTWAAANLDRGFNRGLEAETGYRAPGFTASAAWTRNISKAASAGGTYELLNFSPAHRFSLAAEARSEAWSFSFTGRGVSAQYTGRGGTGLRLPEYWVFGLNAAHKMGRAELWCGVANLLDRRYAETADVYNGWYPQPGRAFTAGIRISFA